MTCHQVVDEVKDIINDGSGGIDGEGIVIGVSDASTTANTT